MKQGWKHRLAVVFQAPQSAPGTHIGPENPSGLRWAQPQGTWSRNRRPGRPTLSKARAEQQAALGTRLHKTATARLREQELLSAWKAFRQHVEVNFSSGHCGGAGHRKVWLLPF